MPDEQTMTSLRAKLLIALVLAGTACDDRSECDPVESSVEPIGAEVFTVDYMHEPGSVALFRDGERVQLLEGAREQPTREVRATLSAVAVDILEAAEAALGSGEGLGGFDQACLTFIDKPNVQLWLGVANASLSFRYPWGCPPSGLAEIDAVLRELVISLPSCNPTPLVTACEVVGE